MRRVAWVAVAVVVAALVWSVVPSALATRRVREAVRTQVQPAGGLDVRVRTTLAGLLGRRARTIDIDAAGVRLGDVIAQRLRMRLRGVQLRERDGGSLGADVDAGTAEVEVAGADLEQLLRTRGVERPSVSINTERIAVTGGVRVGPVFAEMRLTGQFYVVGATDIHFRITALNMSGVEVPPDLATTALALTTTPVLSLKGLPVAVAIERIDAQAGKVVLYARAGTGAP
jgi:hypothetical protein